MLHWQILKDFIPSDHLCVFFQLIQLDLNRIEGCLSFIMGAFGMTVVIKNLPSNTEDIRDVGSVPGLGRFSGEGNGNSLQYSCLENPIDKGAWQATVHGVAESDTTEVT